MNSETLSLSHIFQEPTIIKGKPPALFMLHGYGSDEKGLFSFARDLPKELFIISIKAPFPLQPQGNAWYAINFDDANGIDSDNEQAIQSRDKIANFIDEAIESYNLDSKNISLLGFSQGTILSYSVALSYPEKVKNVIALSGFLKEDIIVKDYKLKDFSNLNIYCSHGKEDQVIPVQWARKTPPLLTKVGIQTILNEFPTGHTVALQNFYQLKDWLSKLI